MAGPQPQGSQGGHSSILGFLEGLGDCFGYGLSLEACDDFGGPAKAPRRLWPLGSSPNASDLGASSLSSQFYCRFQGFGSLLLHAKDSEHRPPMFAERGKVSEPLELQRVIQMCQKTPRSPKPEPCSDAICTPRPGALKSNSQPA